jgi:hypothetical protein
MNDVQKVESVSGKSLSLWLSFSASLSFVAIVMFAAPINAQELLRWKLCVGDRFIVESKDHSSFKLAEPWDRLSSDTDEQLVMEWKVIEIHDDSFLIRGSVKRLCYSINGKFAELNYDSASTASRKGLNAALESRYDSFAKSNFEFTLSNRGEVKNFQLIVRPESKPGTTLAANANIDPKIAEDMKSMVSRCLFTLPENSLLKGDSWNTEDNMEGYGALGAQKAVHDYRYHGIKQVNGTSLAVLKSKCEIQWQPTPNLHINVIDQSSDGEILFELNNGRLQSDKLDQRGTIEVVVRGQKVPGTIDQSSRVAVSIAAKEERLK